MEDTIALIKAISSLIWPICFLLIIFMFRREIRKLLLNLLSRKKDSDDTIGNTPSDALTPAPETAEFDDSPNHLTEDELNPDDQLTVRACKHMDTEKYFVFLSENNEKINTITPLGDIKWIEKKFLQTVEDVNSVLLDEEQLEKLYWWIQNAEPSASISAKVNNLQNSGYLPSYMRLLKNKNTEPSRMLSYIKNRKNVSWFETKEHLHNIYGYKLTSGSMGASLKALETLNLITISGQGENKILSSL